MKNFHDIEITVYRGVRDTTGYKSTLFNFLENVDIDAIKELRATTDPERRREINSRCRKQPSAVSLHQAGQRKTS